MLKLCKLTATDGRAVYINPDSITMISRPTAGAGTRIFFDDNGSVEVVEKVDDVLAELARDS